MPSPTMRFVDQVAIITGAAGGIGLATAKRMGSEGSRVVLIDLHQDKLDQASAAVLSLGAPQTWVVPCDVSKESEVIAVMAEVIQRFGRVDVVVNNAAAILFKPLVEHTEADWRNILQVNLLGAFFFTKQAFRLMKTGGAIVNVASVHAEQTSPLVASYAASKAALVSLTRSAAIEGKPLGIRVNAVVPGAVDTPMLWNNPNLRSGAEQIDPADVGKPEEIAAAIAFLASRDASFIQGEAIRVDGGRLARL